ncbi:MAG: PCMD domain-containing protein [Bacteroidia bacterium]|nr:PCMD domain-containing protein [Bacteroidia bacterium]
MTKTYFQLICAFLFAIELNAQNALPNPGFENWTSQGLYEDPDNWSTLNPSTAVLGILTALKASGSDVHTGSYAIKLTTKNVLGQNANGIATTGSINTSTQTISGGIAYTSRPDSIGGWYKYTPAGSDNGFVAFVLLDAVNDTIGFANFTTPNSTIGTYTYFSAAINYTSSANPVLARCLLSSSAGFTAVVNSTLIIDDLQLIFNSTGIRESHPSTLSLNYNSVTGKLSIQDLNRNYKKASVVDYAGRTITEFQTSAEFTEVSLPALAVGIYFVIVYDNAHKPGALRKFMVY